MPAGTGLIETIAEVVFLGLLFQCGYEDVRHRRVRNSSVAVLFLYSALFTAFISFVSPTLSGIVLPMLAWALLSLVAYVLYCLGVIGAGDVKVLAGGALFGYMRWGLAFSWSLSVLFFLDVQWYRRYGQLDGQKGTPLVWLWAWACGLFFVGERILVFMRDG